jgi:hypothetical protein
MDEIDAVKIEELAEGTGLPPIATEYRVEPYGQVTTLFRLPLSGTDGSMLVIAVDLKDRNPADRKLFVEHGKALIEAIQFFVKRRALRVTRTPGGLMRAEAVEGSPIPD